MVQLPFVNGGVVGVSSDRTNALVNEHHMITTVEGCAEGITKVVGMPYITRNLNLDKTTLNIVNEEKHHGTVALVNENPETANVEGTDVITGDGINNLGDIIPVGDEVNGASVDVTYAGLVALVYNTL